MSRFFFKDKNVKEVQLLFKSNREYFTRFEKFLLSMGIECEKINPKAFASIFLFWCSKTYPFVLGKKQLLPETFCSMTIVDEEELEFEDKSIVAIIVENKRGKELQHAQSIVNLIIEEFAEIDITNIIKNVLFKTSVIYKKDYVNTTYEVLKEAGFAQTSFDLALSLQNFLVEFTKKGNFKDPVNVEFAAHCYLDLVRKKNKFSEIQIIIESVIPEKNKFKDAVLVEAFEEKDRYLKATLCCLKNADTQFESRVIPVCLPQLQNYLIDALGINLYYFDEVFAAQCFLDLTSKKFGYLIVLDSLKYLPSESDFKSAIEEEIERRKIEYQNAIVNILEVENILENGVQILPIFLQKLQKRLASKMGISPMYIDPQMAAEAFFHNIDGKFSYKDIKSAAESVFEGKDNFKNAIRAYINKKKEEYLKFFSDVFEPLSSSEKDGESLSKILPNMYMLLIRKFEPFDWQLVANIFLDSTQGKVSFFDVENSLKALSHENPLKCEILNQLQLREEERLENISKILKKYPDLSEFFSRFCLRLLDPACPYKPVDYRLIARDVFSVIKEEKSCSEIKSAVEVNFPGEHPLKNTIIAEIEKERGKYLEATYLYLQLNNDNKKSDYLDELFRNFIRSLAFYLHPIELKDQRCPAFKEQKVDKESAAEALFYSIKGRFSHSDISGSIDRALSGDDAFKFECLKQLGPMPIFSECFIKTDKLSVAPECFVENGVLPPSFDSFSSSCQSFTGPPKPFLDFSKAPHNEQVLPFSSLLLPGGK